MGIPTLTVGTPSPAVEINYSSLDSLAVKSKLGLLGTVPQFSYVGNAYTACTANAALGTVLAGGTLWGSKAFPAGSWADARYPGYPTAGAIYKINVHGIISTAAAGNTTAWSIGWIPAGGSYAAIASISAYAPSQAALTNADTDIEIFVQCRAYSATAGSLYAFGKVQIQGAYVATTLSDSKTFTGTALSSIDTTQAFTLDVQLKYDAANASNTFTAQYVTIEQLN